MSYNVKFALKAGLASVAAATMAAVGAPTPASAASEKIVNYVNFNNATDLLLNGGAAVIAGPGPKQTKVLRLTPAARDKSGSVFAPVTVDPEKSFTTTFTARLTQNSFHADGIAFILQAVGPKARGANGGALGYTGIQPSFAVEYDTYRNSWDADDNHVAVATGGDASQTMFATKTAASLHGAPFKSTVSYNAKTKVLKVYVNAASTAGAGPAVISQVVDLPAALGTDPVHVGFTGATGTFFADQDITKWTVTVTK